jgi:hypothetical protein
MTSAHRMRIHGFVLFTLVALTSTATAGWDPDGNPICTAAGVQQFQSGVADGSGGVYIVWLDARGGNNVYAQHILANGNVAPGWPLDGLALTTTGSTSQLNAGSDGSGGLMIVYVYGGIRALRILPDGTVAPGFPPGGKLISTNTRTFMQSVTDGAGGAYILKDTNPPPFDIYPGLNLTRITVDGTIAAGWSEDGMLLWGSPFGSAAGPALKACPGGDALCTFSGFSDGQIDYRYGTIRRFHRNGSSALNIGCPAPLSGGEIPGVGPPNANDDGLGGVVATWTDTQPNHFPYTGQSGIFGGRWSAASVSQWPSPTTMPAVLTPFGDGTGAAYLVGKYGSMTGFVVHRRAPDGSIPAGWTSNGIPLSNPLSSQDLSCLPVSTGLASCWSENTSGGGLDIRALVLTSAGTVASGWSAGGSAVCTAPGNQTNPVLIPDGTGGVIACWQDQRNNATTGTDLYAAKLQPDGVVAAQAALAGASAEPGLIRLHWYSPDGATFHATLERATAGAEFAAIAEVQADGTGHVRYEDRDVVSGMTYRYRLAVEDETGRHTLGEVSLRVPDALRLALEPARPNPSSGRFTLSFVLPNAEPARIELLDVSGRRVHARMLDAARAGLQLLPLDLDLAPGIYVARLTQSGHSVTTRVVRAE